MAFLSVNLDLLAALRATRGLLEPDPAQAAVLAELAGADGIAVQVRRDRRYIRERDLYVLREIVKTKLALELPPADDMIEKAIEVKPWMAVLVADHADSDSPVSPIDFGTAPIDFSDLVNRLTAMGISVGFFVQPDGDAIRGAAKAGASAALIDCAGYTQARTVEEAQNELDKIDRAARSAAKSNLAVHCGRGINYRNVGPLAELGCIDEFVVGHAIACRAILVGFERAVREMLELIRGVPPHE